MSNMVETGLLPDDLEIVGWNSPAIADRIRAAIERQADEIIRLREALEGLVKAIEKDANGGAGISGYTGARLSDARDALAAQKEAG